jgi:hypothetical protein
VRGGQPGLGGQPGALPGEPAGQQPRRDVVEVQQPAEAGLEPAGAGIEAGVVAHGGLLP